MRGPRHSEEVRLAFRAEYLKTRNATASAKVLKVPERTGRVWAAALDKDPDFASDCRTLRARALPMVEAALLEGAQHALSFMHDGGRDGAAWFRALAEAHKVIATARVALAEDGSIQAHEPTKIEIILPDGAKAPNADGAAPTE